MVALLVEDAYRINLAMLARSSANLKFAATPIPGASLLAMAAYLSTQMCMCRRHREQGGCQ
jgi:hypothetical protein